MLNRDFCLCPLSSYTATNQARECSCLFPTTLRTFAFVSSYRKRIALLPLVYRANCMYSFYIMYVQQCRRLFVFPSTVAVRIRQDNKSHPPRAGKIPPHFDPILAGILLLHKGLSWEICFISPYPRCVVFSLLDVFFFVLLFAGRANEVQLRNQCAAMNPGIKLHGPEVGHDVLRMM